MKEAILRFYAELNDFLPVRSRYVELPHTFEGRVSVKDMVESLGVPHTEIDLILANGESVDFSYLVENGDRVSVYPMFESLDIKPLLKIRPEPLRQSRFVLDSHLGKLATYLRMLGFDALYRNDYCDEELAAISGDQGRILLTRDRGLLKRSRVSHGYCIRKMDPKQQIVEVVRRFDLSQATSPFKRCLRCNGLLRPVAKHSIAHRLLPRTLRDHDEFHICAACQQIYWKGSHYQRMQQLIGAVLDRDF